MPKRYPVAAGGKPSYMSGRPDLADITRDSGRTYCEQAGITLRDKPAPLYQTLVLATLLAKPIAGDIAVAASRELRRAGMRTPAAMRAATWQQRVDALGRAHYRRYDESTAGILDKSAALIIDRYRGDLRRLADAAGGDVSRAEELLQKIPGIGPSGAAIFLREVQRVWPWARPYVDDRVLAGARRAGLPASSTGLRRLLTRSRVDVTAACAALVRVRLG